MVDDENAMDKENQIVKLLYLELGDAAKETGGMLQDWAKYFKYKNLNVVYDQVRRGGLLLFK